MRDWEFENIVKHWIGIVSVDVGLTFPGVHVRYQKHPHVRVVETTLITSRQIVGCTTVNLHENQAGMTNLPSIRCTTKSDRSKS